MPGPQYIDVPTYKLSHGGSIPAVGLGTWQSQPGEVEHAVEVALKNGYRHVDGAFVYKNEKEVGEGLKASGVPRSDVFLTSKLWCTHHRNVEEAVKRSLDNFGTDYLDLYLIHWPVPLNPNGNDPLFPRKEDGTRDRDTEWSINDTWRQMEAVLEKGLVKAIGVSNFSESMLESLLKTAKVVPVANQIELHPYLPQHDLVAYLASKDILAQAYSPLGSTDSPLLKDEEIQKIADKHGVSVGTVLISYQVNRGVVVLPKSVTEKRIIDNFKLIKLDEDDMATLNGLHKTKGKRFIKPDWNVDLGFKDW
ncbi:NADP-dependent oxidoreductase domain-containing protein [Rhodotorula diobovata]|uniref:NADP-dependent oxidoreductase domain-containing protein n=1 Tax=Rhodotorula diobovata TaxID=5288 RepID=A0A5C5FVE2_9BASI|nr:NADP-dependent oxidoreductase domain-containing protein [Rhodotorula diobovata]